LMTGLDAATQVYLEVCQGGDAVARLCGFLDNHRAWLVPRGGRATVVEHIRYAVSVVVDDVRTITLERGNG